MLHQYLSCYRKYYYNLNRTGNMNGLSKLNDYLLDILKDGIN